MLGEIRTAAYPIPVHTPRALGLKARIASRQFEILWETGCEERHADLRHLIEGALSLAGLDRIRPTDFSFKHLLPGYAGPKRYRDVPEGEQPPASHTPKPAPGTIHALGAEAQSLWDCHVRLDRQRSRCDDVDRAERRRRMDMVLERIAAIEAQASFHHATSMADLMFQIARVHDRVTDICDNAKEGFDSTLAERGIARILASMMTFLMQQTGLTMRDIGAQAYMDASYEMAIHELDALDQKVFGADFDENGTADDQWEAA